MIGPYAIEKDYSQYVTKASAINYAVIGTATRGPIGVPVLCTNTTDLLRKFGPASPDHLALYAANYYLNAGSTCYFVRASHMNTPSGGTTAPVATVATAVLKGTVGEQTNQNVLTLNSVEPGTFFNGLTIRAEKKSGSAETDKIYMLKVFNAANELLESKQFDLANDDPEYFSSAYIKIVSVVANAVSLNTEASDAVTMSGGTNGDVSISGSTVTTIITANDYVYNANSLKSSLVDMNLFCMPGVTDKTAIASMLQLAEDRGDCMFLVDPPQDCDTPDKVRAWVDGTGTGTGNRLVSSYGALYWSWQWILDQGKKVLVPPSVVLGYTFARAARDTELWFPVAGVQRGLVNGIYEPVYAPSQEEVDGLYREDEAVNCIINDPTYGPVIWGQKTLLRGNTSLNRVNVRMLLNYLKKVIIAACKYLTFEPNDQVTWNQFEDMVEPTLSSIGNRRGMYEYKIVKGESLVTDDDIDNYRMPCKILIKPTKVAEEIPIYFVITSTGADFNNVLEAEGIVEV